MSSNFDWKTEEDFDWDEPAETPPPEPSTGRYRRWLKILVVLLLVSGAAALLLRQVNQRVDENREAMRSDIVSSHNLLRVAEEEQDDELFFSLLSGRDSTWTAAQHKLFQSQSLRNRAPFGLQLQPGDPPTPEEENDALSITFSPDMTSAEVTTLLPYEIQIGNGLTETVLLQETALYRLGRERWLLSPPDEPFWGDPLQSENTRIALDYRQRDEEIATRLLTDLESKLEELCSQLTDIECDRDLQLNITLSTDPQTLVDAAQPRAGLLTDAGLRINLPSPTLVGMPQDEEGYQALFRGYAAQMATAIISQQIGYECCEKLPIYQALIDRQMSQLALETWPVVDAHYERILREQVSLHDYSSLWQSADPADIYGPEGWQIYALVDFLLATLPDSNPTMLQRELVRRGSFRSWLNALFAEESSLSDSALLSALSRDFWVRGYRQALNMVEQWEAAAPGQDLYLSCVAPGQGIPDGQTSLYRYDMDGEAWQSIYRTPNSLWAASLPGDDLLLQQEYNHETGRWTAVLRQDEQVMPLLPIGEDLTVSFGHTDPEASGLSAFVFPPDGEEATITWFDLDDCDVTAGCDNQEIPGIPIWAPDGEHALFTDNPMNQIDLLRTELRTVLFYSRRAENTPTPLYIGDRLEFLGEQPVIHAEELARAGRGHAPFWIDDNTFGYIIGAGEPIAQRGSRVMSVNIDESEPQMLFSLSDLMEAIGEGSNSSRLFWIQYVMVHPSNPDRLFVVVFSTQSRGSYLLKYDRPSGDVQLLLSSGYFANHSLSLSPDGRYLLFGGTDELDPAAGEESALLQVYDLQRDEVIPFLSLTSDFAPYATYDWSLDGQWLALLLDDGMAGIFSPDVRQLRLIATPEGACGTPVWIN